MRIDAITRPEYVLLGVMVRPTKHGWNEILLTIKDRELPDNMANVVISMAEFDFDRIRMEVERVRNADKSNRGGAGVDGKGPRAVPDLPTVPGVYDGSSGDSGQTY